MSISFADIDDALRQEDVEGLLGLGAPQDEYSYVAEIITDAFLRSNADKLTEANASEIIISIWMEQFSLTIEDISLRIPAIQRVVRRIMENL